jgi:hypothetical protein
MASALDPDKPHNPILPRGAHPVAGRSGRGTSSFGIKERRIFTPLNQAPFNIAAVPLKFQEHT